MDIELRITFTGLCVFVPDGDKVHVLLPRTRKHIISPHGGHGAATAEVEHHAPRLIFDTGYTRPVTTKDGVRVYVDLTERALEMPPIGDALNPMIPRQILDLSDITGKPISRDLLLDDPDEKLIARITLVRGSVETFEPGVCWNLQEASNRRLPHRLRWLIKMPEQELEWTLRLLHEAGTVPLPKLHHIERRINLFVHHTVPAELPPEPEVLTPPLEMEAHHFKAYYSLFELPSRTPIPRFKGDTPDCTGAMDAATPLSRRKGASPFTCMVAQARP